MLGENEPNIVDLMWAQDGYLVDMARTYVCGKLSAKLSMAHEMAVKVMRNIESAVRPGATEVCNGRDDDCDGVVDEGTTAATTVQSVTDPGAETSEFFGHAVAVVGDVDADRVDDFAVGAYQDDPGGTNERGSAALCSGRTRALICRAVDPEGLANDYLGWSVAGVGDLDHDGRPDFAAGALYDDVGSAYNGGSVVVFSGATCARLLKLTDPTAVSNDYLGSSVAGPGDVNRDGSRNDHLIKSIGKIQHLSHHTP